MPGDSAATRVGDNSPQGKPACPQGSPGSQGMEWGLWKGPPGLGPGGARRRQGEMEAGEVSTSKVSPQRGEHCS